MMEGNKKIGLTAELVASIKSKNNISYSYFVTKRARRFFSFFSHIFGEKSLQDIFNWRLRLSEEFDNYLFKKRISQIVDLGAGYSLRGFEACLKNKNLIYIELDFANVVNIKKEILKEICKKEMLNFPKNYILIECDLLKEPIKDKIKHFLDKDKILFFAEGLVSYFNEREFNFFVDNIKSCLNKNDLFFCHENFKKPTGWFSVFRKILSIITFNKAYKHFLTKKDIVDYSTEKGFSKINVYEKDKFLFYEVGYE